MNNKRFDFQAGCKSWCKEKEKHVKITTMAAYILIINRHLLPYFGTLSSISQKNISCFLSLKKKEDLSKNTLKDIINVLRMILKHINKKGGMGNLQIELRIPAEYKLKDLPIFSVSQQKKLMRYLITNLNLRNLGLLVCLHTGLRIGEICALRWGDIDFERRLIKVEKTLSRIYIPGDHAKKTRLIISTPKTPNSFRMVPMSQSLLKIMKQLPSDYNPDYYILNDNSSPLDPRCYRNYYNKILKHLQLPDIKFHGLRHSFATRCIESHCDYKSVSAILGHSNIRTTLDLYVHPSYDQKRTCIEKMLKNLR